MPECVDVHRLNNTRFLFSLIHRPLHSSLGIPPVKISACTTNDLLSFTVEQPLNRLFGFQVRLDPTDQDISQWNVTVLFTFAILHMEDFSMEVQVGDLQIPDLKTAKSTTVQQTDQHPVFE